MSEASLTSHSPISQSSVTLTHPNSPSFSLRAPNPGPAATEAATLPPSQRDAGDTDSFSVPEASVSLIGERQADPVEHHRRSGLPRRQGPTELGACTTLLGLKLCLHQFPNHYVVSLYFILKGFGVLFCRTRVLGKCPSLKLQPQPKRASCSPNVICLLQNLGPVSCISNSEEPGMLRTCSCCV